MDSALTPREIQARIRAGEPLSEVARAAGMGIEWVEPFAAPVLAEREVVAGQAQSHPVRRGAETIAHRTLGQVVEDRLASRRVDAETVVWDAWKIEARRWLVRVDYDSGKSHREARFIYDASGRFSSADNDDARWLLGLQSASHGPQPGRRRRDEEAEPTVDLNDELALVRVVQPRVDEPADSDDTMRLEDVDGEIDDAYAEGELAEVDGVYDIVPTADSGLDVLYDMLSSFDEDSVQIYAGLIRPSDKPAAAPVLAAAPGEKVKVGRDADLLPAPSDDALPGDEVSEPEQPALVEEPPARTKRKRAHVPSWDEIMFGSPRNPQKR